jgi:GTP cyclohydrolase I
MGRQAEWLIMADGNDHWKTVEHRTEIEAAAELFGGVGVSRPEVEEAVHNLLVAVGEDPEREGLLKTPERVARMYDELLAGYRVDPQAMINDALFTVEYDEMVVVRDIDFYSLCEHHMLPFLGQAHVAYLPKGQVIGLSKIPRVVDLFSRRLQVQERMTRQIADFLETALHPHGVAVVVEGWHLCAMMRGVKKANARMVTSALCGTFSTSELTRQEFMSHISRGSHSILG